MFSYMLAKCAVITTSMTVMFKFPPMSVYEWFALVGGWCIRQGKSIKIWMRSGVLTTNFNLFFSEVWCIAVNRPWQRSVLSAGTWWKTPKTGSLPVSSWEHWQIIIITVNCNLTVIYFKHPLSSTFCKTLSRSSSQGQKVDANLP